MAEIEGGLFWLGYGGRASKVARSKRPRSANYDFAFDNEKPAHQVFLQDFAIDRAPVSNGDYLEFMSDGGYQNFRWWFSEGWEAVNREHWQAPLYWELHDGEWMIRDFAGLHPVAEQSERAGFARQLSSKPRRLRSGPANVCRPKPNGKRRRALIRPAQAQKLFPGATTAR